MKENTQDENETEAQIEKVTGGDEQYVVIDDLNADIVVLGVYDEYEEADERVKEQMCVEFPTVDEPYAEKYERFGSKDATVYFVGDGRIPNYQIHKVSQ